MKNDIMERYFYRRNPFAVRTAKGFYVPVYRDVTEADIARHLAGLHTIGAYQSRADETCRWSCIDFDDFSYLEVAKRIAKKHGGKLEMSESKGFHVWFFYDEPIPTINAYIDVTDALSEFNLKAGRESKIDVFPRSAHLSGKRVGWLVRVPTTPFMEV